MPATRITIAVNAQQSIKAPLVLPAAAASNPAENNSYRALIAKTAQAKLRVKKPSRFFVARDGHELETEADWKAAICDDAVILVSVGEEYVGIRKGEAVDSNDKSKGNLLVISAYQLMITPVVPMLIFAHSKH
jgi:hypothetical protein